MGLWRRSHARAMSEQAYLNEIGRYPLLTKAQEIGLGAQIQAWMKIADKDESEYTEEEKQIAKAGKRARKKFIECNLRLVVSVAKKYAASCKTLDLMDLIEEGNIGLVKAVEKFDPTLGYAMSTYAYWWIRQAVQRAIHSSEYLIRLPSNVHESLSKIRKKAEELEKELMRQPTISEIAARCNMSAEEVSVAVNAPRSTTSLDSTGSGGDRPSALVELICDESTTNTIEDAEDRIQTELLRSVIDSCLDEISKFVLMERMKDPPTAWRKISTLTGIGMIKLRQIEENAINRCSMLIRLESQL